MPVSDPVEAERPVVLVPTYNERENLDRALTTIFEHKPDIAVCVIDDASPDGTGALADAWAVRPRRVHVLHRRRKEGLGRAYLHGFAWALEHADNFTHVLQMDADLSHDARFIEPLLEACRRGADVALGSRYVDGGGVSGWGIHRRILSVGGNLYAKTVLGVPIADLTGGFKCFRREVLELLPRAQVSTVGYGFQIEVTYRALAQGFSVVEVPIVFPDRVHGQSKMSLRICWEGLSAVWKLRLQPPGER